MQNIFEWLALPPAENPHNLKQTPNESDSYYRFNYLHTRHRLIQPPQQRLIPARIQQQFDWYYRTFYPGLSSS